MPTRPQHPFTVRRADWERDQTELRALRLHVFVREQQVPESVEWDGLDTEAVHLIAESEHGQAIGTARLLPSGQIGRMAVTAPWRRRGVGTRLVLTLLSIAAEQGFGQPFLNAQVSVLPFYRGLGFAPEGEVFDEAGIAHQRMVLRDNQPLLAVDIDTRLLGHTAGVLRLDDGSSQARAVGAIAIQASRELAILTPDLEPALYDQPGVLDAARRLALARPGRQPVRILLGDAEPCLRRAHRLIDLSRLLTSAIGIRVLPDELAAQRDHYLIADGTGYFRRRDAGRGSALANFADRRQARRLRHRFDQLWEQSLDHPDLRRLFV